MHDGKNQRAITLVDWCGKNFNGQWTAVTRAMLPGECRRNLRQDILVLCQQGVCRGVSNLRQGNADQFTVRIAIKTVCSSVRILDTTVCIDEQESSAVAMKKLAKTIF